MFFDQKKMTLDEAERCKKERRAKKVFKYDAEFNRKLQYFKNALLHKTIS